MADDTKKRGTSVIAFKDTNIASCSLNINVNVTDAVSWGLAGLDRFRFGRNYLFMSTKRTKHTVIYYLGNIA